MKKFKKNIQEPSCAVDYAFKRIGGKYKGRILWYLHVRSLMRYGDLRKALFDATPKMLTQSLRELEDDALIRRRVYTEIPPKVEYSLTEVGMELIPFIMHLKEWAEVQIKKQHDVLG